MSGIRMRIVRFERCAGEEFGLACARYIEDKLFKTMLPS